MKKQILDAFMVFCISHDLLDSDFISAFELFKSFVKKHFEGSMEFASAIILEDAAHDIRLGISYGIYNEEISKYYRTE